MARRGTISPRTGTVTVWVRRASTALPRACEVEKSGQTPDAQYAVCRTWHPSVWELRWLSISQVRERSGGPYRRCFGGLLVGVEWDIELGVVVW